MITEVSEETNDIMKSTKNMPKIFTVHPSKIKSGEIEDAPSNNESSKNCEEEIKTDIRNNISCSYDESDQPQLSGKKTFCDKSNKSPKRNLKEFLNNQTQFLVKKSTKINKSNVSLREKEQSYMRNSPKINKKTLPMSNATIGSKSHNKLDVVEGLTSNGLHRKTTNKFKVPERNKLKISKSMNRTHIQLAHDKISFKKEIIKELDDLLAKHNPKNSPIPFLVFCNF